MDFDLPVFHDPELDYSHKLVFVMLCDNYSAAQIARKLGKAGSYIRRLRAKLIDRGHWENVSPRIRKRISQDTLSAERISQDTPGEKTYLPGYEKCDSPNAHANIVPSPTEKELVVQPPTPTTPDDDLPEQTTLSKLQELWHQVSTRAFDYSWCQVQMNKYSGDVVIAAFESCIADDVMEDDLDTKSIKKYINAILRSSNGKVPDSPPTSSDPNEDPNDKMRRLLRERAETRQQGA